MSGRRILVVEDQEDNRTILRDLLTHAGFVVLEAVTGEEGVRAAEAHRPDLILMDIQLPGMDGLELTRRLKADPRTAGILVVALTAYAMKGDEEKARAAGCDGYISKPIDTRALPVRVAAYLEGQEVSARWTMSPMSADDQTTWLEELYKSRNDTTHEAGSFDDELP